MSKKRPRNVTINLNESTSSKSLQQSFCSGDSIDTFQAATNSETSSSASIVLSASMNTKSVNELSHLKANVRAFHGSCSSSSSVCAALSIADSIPVQILHQSTLAKMVAAHSPPKWVPVPSKQVPPPILSELVVSSKAKPYPPVVPEISLVNLADRSSQVHTGQFQGSCSSSSSVCPALSIADCIPIQMLQQNAYAKTLPDHTPLKCGMLPSDKMPTTILSEPLLSSICKPVSTVVIEPSPPNLPDQHAQVIPPLRELSVREVQIAGLFYNTKVRVLECWFAPFAGPTHSAFVKCLVYDQTGYLAEIVVPPKISDVWYYKLQKGNTYALKNVECVPTDGPLHFVKCPYFIMVGEQTQANLILSHSIPFYPPYFPKRFSELSELPWESRFLIDIVGAVIEIVRDRNPIIGEPPFLESTCAYLIDDTYCGRPLELVIEKGIAEEYSHLFHRTVTSSFLMVATALQIAPNLAAGSLCLYSTRWSKFTADCGQSEQAETMKNWFLS